MKAVWAFVGCLNAASLIVFMLAGSAWYALGAICGVVLSGWLYDQEGES